MINQDLIKGMAKKLDSLLDFNKIIPNKIIGAAAEMADGYIFNAGLSYLNAKFGERIPNQYVDEVETMIAAFNAGDYTGMLAAVPAGFDQAIDIKFLDDDFEAIFIATNFNAAVQAALYYGNLQVSKKTIEQ